MMISKEDIFNAVCIRYSTSDIKLKGKSREGDLDSARKILAMLLKKYVVASYKGVGLLMHRSPSSMFELIDDGTAKLKVDRTLMNNYNSIEYSLLNKNEKR